MSFGTLRFIIPAILFLYAVLFIFPLYMFARKLWICRSQGLSEYMSMAHRYVSAFDRKWLRDETATGESQLGTGDIQSLADLTNSVNIIDRMRTVPIGRRLIVVIAATAVLPLIPLLLLKFQINELAVLLFKMFIG
jgi:hypothetical protein